MTSAQIKDFIKEELLNKNLKLNSSAIRFNKIERIKEFLEKIDIGDSLIEKLYLFYNEVDKKPLCKECGKELKFISFNKGYNSYCSAKCSGKQSKKAIQEKYGVENVFQLDDIKEKIKKTNLEKYGQENPWGFGSDYHKKAIQEKYGVENVFQLDDIKEKIKKTNLEKYGVEHNSYNIETIKKRKIKRLKNFYSKITERTNNKVIPLFNIKNYNGVQKKYKWKCNDCDVIFFDHLDDGHIPRCPQCYPRLNGYSKAEKDIVEFIKSLKIENIIENDREIIKPYEVDIYLPDYNLAIEYNGLYYHSIKFINDKYYHQNKVKLANEKEIRLLHIWEHEWLENPIYIKQ
ncbi:MAG: DUF7487 domain-containing protein, partial [Nanoarchaeota archaeon]